MERIVAEANWQVHNLTIALKPKKKQQRSVLDIKLRLKTLGSKFLVDLRITDGSGNCGSDNRVFTVLMTLLFQTANH